MGRASARLVTLFSPWQGQPLVWGLWCLPMGIGLGNALRDLLVVFGERVWDP